jgi:hypothetical protein
MAPPIPLSKLTVGWTNILVAEHSDLYRYVDKGRFPAYVDVENERSGNVVTFEKSMNLTHEGELSAVDYEPIGNDQRKFPKVKGWKLRIFND